MIQKREKCVSFFRVEVTFEWCEGIIAFPLFISIFCLGLTPHGQQHFKRHFTIESFSKVDHNTLILSWLNIMKQKLTKVTGKWSYNII